jgi:hypothetical protein
MSQDIGRRCRSIASDNELAGNNHFAERSRHGLLRRSQHDLEGRWERCAMCRGRELRSSPDKATQSFWARFGGYKTLDGCAAKHATRIDFEKSTEGTIAVPLPFLLRLFHPVCRV